MIKISVYNVIRHVKHVRVAQFQVALLVAPNILVIVLDCVKLAHHLVMIVVYKLRIVQVVIQIYC